MIVEKLKEIEEARKVKDEEYRTEMEQHDYYAMIFEKAKSII